MSAKYGSLDNSAAVVVTDDSGAVLCAPDHRADLWADMLAWEAAGNIIEPADPPPTDSEKDEESAQQFQKIGSVNRAILQFFFEHENRIRTLETRPSVTIQQVYNWFKAKIRGA